ncbi:MAG TPA: hypothetical protein VKV32_11405, partial [Stellaceae bacterium]|nr:hypothetical protein [Stellaceae bacterium]
MTLRADTPASASLGAGLGAAIGEWPIVALALGVATLLLGVTAPHHGEFWWSDAPRHALNGVFVKDFVAAMPIHDPVGFAT